MNLIGTWEHQSTVFITEDGVHYSCGSNSSGLLIYTASGHMSVCLNRDTSVLPEVLQRIVPAHLSYAGTYHLNPNKDVVTHRATSSSNREHIGRDQIRDAVLDGETLKLSATGRLGAIITWKKIAS